MNDIDVVWENTVDQGKFRVMVTQPNKQVVFQEGDKLTFDDSGTTGMLKVEVTDTGEVLLEEEVNIRAGAIFGPDAEDLFFWQESAIKVIDAWIERSN